VNKKENFGRRLARKRRRISVEFVLQELADSADFFRGIDGVDDPIRFWSFSISLAI
jgi:hypothetical protein